MNQDNASFSPKQLARIGGLAYLVIILSGLISEMFIRNSLIVPGNAAATFKNISDNNFQWRISIALDVLMHVCDLILAIVYYSLLKPVNKRLAQLSLFFGLIQTAVLVSNKMNLVTPTLLLNSSGYLQAFSSEQIQSLSYLSIRSHEYGLALGFVFFGISCIMDGYLFIKSGFLPKALGIILQIAGICYLVNSTTLLLFPEYSDAIFPIVFGPIGLSELSVSIWLLIKGVNEKAWYSLNGKVAN